ncbi:hypothetical protein PGTUg99_028856 [Puccinia graminis f. sp. tritici]|uniref:RRM domain-containing protein n=1 Tax=Puccinia graminis f. sp. tritici TaxID=56615 RepID=A0A5B0RQS4_PUCGR|nr:hypothetical protein PGTUg99_028856 [Puccinia graminis f. sp. tritici]
MLTNARPLYPVFLTNIAPGTTDGDICAALASYGSVHHCLLPCVAPDKELCAIVVFACPKEANLAIKELDGAEADGYLLSARAARDDERSALALLARMS